VTDRCFRRQISSIRWVINSHGQVLGVIAINIYFVDSHLHAGERSLAVTEGFAKPSYKDQPFSTSHPPSHPPPNLPHNVSLFRLHLGVRTRPSTPTTHSPVVFPIREPILLEDVLKTPGHAITSVVSSLYCVITSHTYKFSFNRQQYCTDVINYDLCLI
jgi:hypothetical protein